MYHQQVPHSVILEEQTGEQTIRIYILVHVHAAFGIILIKGHVK